MIMVVRRRRPRARIIDGSPATQQSAAVVVGLDARWHELKSIDVRRITEEVGRRKVALLERGDVPGDLFQQAGLVRPPTASEVVGAPGEESHRRHASTAMTSRDDLGGQSGRVITTRGSPCAGRLSGRHPATNEAACCCRRSVISLEVDVHEQSASATPDRLEAGRTHRATSIYAILMPPADEKSPEPTSDDNTAVQLGVVAGPEIALTRCRRTQGTGPLNWCFVPIGEVYATAMPPVENVRRPAFVATAPGRVMGASSSTSGPLKLVGPGRMEASPDARSRQSRSGLSRPPPSRRRRRARQAQTDGSRPGSASRRHRRGGSPTRDR